MSRLAMGTSQQLNRVEVSPYGLHWPDLDEDLSLRGLLEGDYGQEQECRVNGYRRRPEPKPCLVAEEKTPYGAGLSKGEP